MRRKIPATHTLLCFEAAARHESYTRAAQELSLTQSAVSRQITSLEEFLGQTLFRRTRHGVALTPRGAEYATQVAERLRALERDTLNAMSHQGAGGAIHLAAVPTFATRWLMPRLPQLAALHPDIMVHIETQTRPFMFTGTGFDAALYAGTPEQVANWAGTRAVALMAEEVVPVCSPALMMALSQPTGSNSQRLLPKVPLHMAPAQVSGLPLLQQSTRPYGWRQWFDAMAVDAPNALSGPRYELFSMTAAAAAHGLGIALVPRLLIEAELARGDLVVACNQPLKSGRSYWLVMPERSDDKPALATFANWLVGVAQDSGHNSTHAGQQASAPNPCPPKK